VSVDTHSRGNTGRPRREAAMREREHTREMVAGLQIAIQRLFPLLHAAPHSPALGPGS